MKNTKVVQGESLKFKRYAWFTLVGFSFMYAFVYNGRFNMELALPLMDKELHMTKTEIEILTAILYWTYAFGNFVNGRLGEIFGCKRFIMAGVILTVLTNWIVSMSTSIRIIIILWGLNGFFQSMIWAPGISLIAQWWPSEKRGFATGFAHGFSGMAHIILWFSTMVTMGIFPQYGWRGFFVIPVIFLFIMSFVYWFMSKEKPRAMNLCDDEGEDEICLERERVYKKLDLKEGKMFPYKCLFTQWQFCVWCVISALASITRYGLLTWIPLYYTKKMHMPIKTGIFSTLVLPMGMALGTFIVPWATDRIWGRNRAIAIIICGALSALMVFIFPSMMTSTTAIITIFWSGFFLYGINGVIWAYSIDVGTRVFAGTAAGILDWAAYMGAAVQAMFFGYILQRTDSWAYVFAAIAMMCILMVILGIITIRQKGLGCKIEEVKK
ncbi:MFS transporter [Crassaminicella profunda]|uniref:MFS transporter n=1 Tax=Crassaminicella profunda TaxID=1286698 RepID=UPI001CA6D161|nr:MFS transporter [Crassaminicella profunda]QZY56087.1 MFS transporter [Crassaminicella profunda]